MYELILGLDHPSVFATVFLFDLENFLPAENAPERQPFLSHSHLDCFNETLSANHLMSTRKSLHACSISSAHHTLFFLLFCKLLVLPFYPAQKIVNFSCEPV